MSWDISIQDLPADVKTVADIPEDYQPRPLGRRADLIARIQELLPDVTFSDQSWGMLDRPGFSIEFNMGAEEICDGFMLHVRGGSSAMDTVARLLQHLQFRGFDCQTGDFFSPPVAQESFKQRQSYRNQVIHPENRPDERRNSGL
jgi:hypothetical protein